MRCSLSAAKKRSSKYLPRVAAILCLILTVLWSTITGFGQRLAIRHYGVSDGLAHSGVRCIHQDAKGYLWFGTQEGLSRFDRYRFTNYGTRWTSSTVRLLASVKQTVELAMQIEHGAPLG